MDRHWMREVISRVADSQYALLGHIVTADAGRAALFRLVERLAAELGVVAVDGVPLAEWYALREADAVQEALEALETGSPAAAARALEILEAIRAAADDEKGNNEST
jgi:hypothetical protein